MSQRKIDRLLRRLVVAEDAVVAELKRLYPEGTRVRVNIRYPQVTPSEADVVAWRGGRYGYVGVRLINSPKQMVRDISLENIERA